MAKLSHKRRHKDTDRRDLRDRARARDRRASDSDSDPSSPTDDVRDYEPSTFDEST